MPFLHVLRLKIGPLEDHTGQAFGGVQQLVFCGQDADRKVARHVHDRRACRAQQRVGHRADNRFEPVVDQRQTQSVELALTPHGCHFLIGTHARLLNGTTSALVAAAVLNSIDNEPEGSITTSASGGTTTVVTGVSMITGP